MGKTLKEGKGKNPLITTGKYGKILHNSLVVLWNGLTFRIWPNQNSVVPYNRVAPNKDYPRLDSNHVEKTKF